MADINIHRISGSLYLNLLLQLLATYVNYLPFAAFDNLLTLCESTKRQLAFTSLPKACIKPHNLHPLHFSFYTVKSRASAHGHSQLKPPKSRVGPYTENLLKRLNYLLASAHPQLLRRSHNLQVCTA